MLAQVSPIAGMECCKAGGKRCSNACGSVGVAGGVVAIAAIQGVSASTACEDIGDAVANQDIAVVRAGQVFNINVGIA